MTGVEDLFETPEAQDVTLDPSMTAFLVLDLGVVTEDPAHDYNSVVGPVAAFLSQAREAGVAVIYTVQTHFKDSDKAAVATVFKRRDHEPVIYPDTFDKFYGDELQPLLEERGVKNLIIAGARSNVAVLYTATSAAHPLGYDVVVPMDGITARGELEQAYTLHQLTHLPGSGARHMCMSTFAKISFGEGA